MKKELYNLKGKKALVTGSGQGIGKHIAIELAQNGAEVIVHYNSDEAKALKTKEIIEKNGGKAQILQGDLSDEATPDLIFEKLYQQNFKPDILILNASVQVRKNWQEISFAEFDFQVNVNVKSSLRLIQLFVPEMKKNKWGRIITIGSLQQKKPHPHFVVYAATKQAMMNIVRNLAVQLAPEGITINNIAPGVFETIRNEKALAEEEYRNFILSKIPMGKFGDLEDCAGITALICSDAGKYITGQDIYVDGGMSIS